MDTFYCKSCFASPISEKLLILFPLAMRGQPQGVLDEGKIESLLWKLI